MSHIRRIEPERPESDLIRVILDELDDLHRIAQVLSLRIAALEHDRPTDRTQARPEEPS